MDHFKQTTLTSFHAAAAAAAVTSSAAPPSPVPLGVLRQGVLAFPLVVTLLSMFFYVFFAFKNNSARDQGRIRLPVSVHEARNQGIRIRRSTSGGYEPVETEADDDYEDEVKAEDPFDIDDEEMFIDGYPINEQGFWKKTFWKKIVVLCLLLPSTVVNFFTFGYLLANLDSLRTPWELKVYLIELTTVLLPVQAYVLVLGTIWLFQASVSRHWSTTIHICSVIFAAWVSSTTTFVLPTDFDLFSSLPGIEPKRVIRLIQIFQAIQPILLLPPLLLAASIPRSPKLHFPFEKYLPAKAIEQMNEKHAETQTSPQRDIEPDYAKKDFHNVTEESNNTVFEALLFSFATPVLIKGYKMESMDVWDLPILTHDMRSLILYREMKEVYGRTQKRRRRDKSKRSWMDRLPPGWSLLAKVGYVNRKLFAAQTTLAVITAFLYYAPAYFLKQLVQYLEEHPNRSDMRWGWLWVVALFGSNVFMFTLVNHLWGISSSTLQTRIKIQLSMLLFSKTLTKKDLAASGGKDEASSASDKKPDDAESKSESEDEEDVASKSQIMTLFTLDTERVADWTFHIFTLVDSPVEIIFASWFLYSLLGVSALYGLLACILTMPLSQFASKVVISTQDNLMKARDERTALMNEVLGGIRMLKFMAWERPFERRINIIRDRELKQIARNYFIETFFNFLYMITPIIITLVAFFHYVLVAKQKLTPSIAFTSVSVFNELRFALNALPETLIETLQGFVSLRRIEKYMSTAEIAKAELSENETVALNSATITWPRDVAPPSQSAGPSTAATPKTGFCLNDLTINFPIGQLSLVCGKLGSGKTLLLLGLLGEADVLTGQVICPRSPPNALEDLSAKVSADDWVKKGLVAYAAQVAFLQNASIKDNILFGSPYDAERYQAVLEACSLISDLSIMEDGDMTEIGERGLSLSGGQRARISLARAAYSRASVILLDDVLSAVDAHTSSFILKNLLQGPIMRNRTVILVSHHVQLVSPASVYVVALDNGSLVYAGDRAGFIAGGHVEAIEEADPQVAAERDESEHEANEKPVDKKLLSLNDLSESNSETSSINSAPTEATAVPASSPPPPEKKKPRKLVEDEQRAKGRIANRVWKAWINAQGGKLYWTIFVVITLVAATTPVWENGWLRRWSGSYSDPSDTRSPLFHVVLYAVITLVGSALNSIKFAVLYWGSVVASRKIHKTMLERVLLATIRFHDTSVRGRVLNRFGKDLEGLDSSTADNWGRTIFYGLNIITTFASIAWVGGWQFVVASSFLCIIYYQTGKLYNHVSRDMRRLDSVNRSPVYALYSEVIAGVQTLRAYGASTSLMRHMVKLANCNIISFYWYWTLNRWLSSRLNLLSSAILGVTGVAVLVAPVSAAQAGFALAFAASVGNDLLFVVRRFVSLEQSMVALERIIEYSELPIEGPEYEDPRPPADWPSRGTIQVRDLVIRYAPELPPVLHGISFDVSANEKVGVVGATGSGKSTLALSLFRFVEPSSGSIAIDGLDIAKVGLTDLRSRVTIIPQDPTILSGTLRSTLDVFDEYDDTAIYEALRRVHLLKMDEETGTASDEGNANVFKNLDNPVSEGGDNFSQGEKQLICMARAILRRNKILALDEATSSIDYETDELISRTIREEFSTSTILTIAHRLATIIDYDKVLVMEQGRIAEYASPAELLRDTKSKFYALCKATGTAEFKKLKATAFEAERKRKEAAQ